MNHNLYAYFERTMPPLSEPFLVAPDGRVRDYQEMVATTARYAALLNSLGLRKGDRVAVQVDKSPEALFVYLACLRAGLVYLPLNTGYTAAELAHFVGDATPRCIVCTPQQADTFTGLSGHGGQILTLTADGTGSLCEAASRLEPDFDTVVCTADDLAAILYTSGTTGRPKGAMLTHGNLYSNAATLHRVWGWREGDVLLHALPIFHVHGLFVACHCVLLNGSKMFFLPRFDTREVMRLLPQSTVMMGVPTFYTRLLADPQFDASSTNRMRLFISGSAPLLEETFHAFRERTGHTILERYGMTETLMLTSNPLDGERIPGSVGPPLPGVSVRIVDERGQPLPAGSVGNIEVRGSNVFPGYWQMPQKTAEEFTADGHFKTGDMGRIDENGYVWIVGRSKDLVISGGYNVYPKEVESVLDQVDGVVESAVFGVPHPDFGEAVTAVIVPANPRQPPAEDEIIRFAREHLAAYKVPKRVFALDALPRNSMGKVQKNTLRERFASSDV